jgi:hypothetical protein
MSKKLGETLVERGVINDGQLATALKAQLVFGGHLGTCMIELGYLDDRLLGEVLSSIHRVDFAPPELLRTIPEATLGLLSAKLAEKHCAVPFRLNERVLQVAMVDPTNLVSLDEIRFTTGCRTVPWVAPEIRIFQALEKHYGIARRVRFIALSRQMDGDAPAPESESQASHEPGGAPEGSPPTSLESDFGPISPEPSEADEATEFTAAGHGYGRSWQEIAEELFEERPAAAQSPVPEKEAERHREIDDPDDMFDRISDRLCSATTMTSIATAVLDYAAAELPRCILFKVGSAVATVWDHRTECDTAALERIRFEVVSEPLFELLAGNDFYKGPVPGEARFRAFFDRLGLTVPREVLIWPIYVNDRLVAILHGDAGSAEKIRVDASRFRRLMSKFAPALSLFILKKKLRVA